MPFAYYRHFIWVDFKAKNSFIFPNFCLKIGKNENGGKKMTAILAIIVISLWPLLLLEVSKCLSTHPIPQTWSPGTSGCFLGPNLSFLVKNMTSWKRFRVLSDVYLIACLEAWLWAWWRCGSTNCIIPMVFRDIKLKNIFYEKICYVLNSWRYDLIPGFARGPLVN